MQELIANIGLLHVKVSYIFVIYAENACIVGICIHDRGPMWSVNVYYGISDEWLLISSHKEILFVCMQLMVNVYVHVC